MIAGTEETHNCAIIYNEDQNNVSMYSFDEDTQTVAVVEELTSYFAANSVTDPTEATVEVADECAAFRINDVILRETGSSPGF